MPGITLIDYISNEEIRRKTKVDIITRVATVKWRWTRRLTGILKEMNGVLDFHREDRDGNECQGIYGS